MFKKIAFAAVVASFAALPACKDNTPAPSTTVDTSAPPSKEPRDICGPGRPPLKDGVKCQ